MSRLGRWDWKLAALGLATAAVAAVVVYMGLEYKTAPVAHAASCTSGPIIDDGLREWCGYFTNAFDDGTSPVGEDIVNGGVPGGVNGATAFIAWIQGMLAGPTGHNKTAAQFIILTMLGENGGNCGSCANRGDANTRFNEWAADVRAAERDGLVDWHFAAPFGCGIENSYYQAGGSNDAAFFHDGDDGCGSGVTVDSIQFWSRTASGGRGSKVFTIRRFCANPIGSLSSIPAADYTVDLTANFKGTTVTPTYAGPRFQVIAGNIYALGEDLHNRGPASSDAGDLQVDWDPRINQWCAPFCVPPAPEMTALTGGAGGSYGYRATAVVPGGSGPDYHWNVNSLNSGVATSSSFEFIPNGAPGTTFNLNVWFISADQSGTKVVHVSVPFIIVSERNPGFVGNNGDIHAGGDNNCPLPMTNPNAFIQGDTAGNSGGQYVVSASGALGDVSSNGTGADTLKLGASGNYAQVCRPDLVTPAAAYCAAGVGVGTLSNVVPNLAQTLTAFPVYCINSGTAKISGTVTNNVTVVATGSADIEVNGNIVFGGGSVARNLVPSLGIISANNIFVDSGAHTVDAYLFADGTIDTCPAADATCNSQLTVNGFLMAKTLVLHRLGANNTNNPAEGEVVNLNPAIYLNPPKFFDSSVDNIQLQSEGERQPLF